MEVTFLMYKQENAEKLLGMQILQMLNTGNKLYYRQKGKYKKAEFL